jgi:hypothetical protein
VVGHLLRTSSLPPFRKYSVMPVARKVWQLSFVVWMPAAGRAAADHAVHVGPSYVPLGEIAGFSLGRAE